MNVNRGSGKMQVQFIVAASAALLLPRAAVLPTCRRADAVTMQENLKGAKFTPAYKANAPAKKAASGGGGGNPFAGRFGGGAPAPSPPPPAPKSPFSFGRAAPPPAPAPTPACEGGAAMRYWQRGARAPPPTLGAPSVPAADARRRELLCAFRARRRG